MRKKLIIIATCIAVICTIFAVNSIKKHEETKRIQIDLNKGDVQKINIEAFPSFFDAFDIADEVEISKVVDYLTSLNIEKTKFEPVSGGAYKINIFLKDGTVREFSHSGNIYLIERGGFTGKLLYKEAAKFQGVVASILEENSINSGKAFITGTIISLNTDVSGRYISCVIRDEKNISHNIYVEYAKIIDADGRLILQDKDFIRVFYNKDIQKDTSIISASTVYIKDKNRID